MPAATEATTQTPIDRDVPWRGVGTRVEGLMTAEEAIRAGGLDWEVVKVPSAGLVDGEWVQDRDRFKTMRSSDGVFLGDVGAIYEPLQNRDAFDFADSLVDSGEAKYDTVGPLRGGRVVFLSMKFPREILIAGEDPIDLYGVLWNSHDGTKAITMMATPIRPVCMNTLQLGLRLARATWSVKHLGSLDGRLAEARESLHLTFRYADAWAKEMDRLAQTPCSDSEFEALAEMLTAPASRLGERWAEGLLSSWETGPARGMHGRSNRYDALNAVTEYGDWLREPRTSMSQTESTLFGAASRVRKHAYAVLAADGPIERAAV